MRVVLNTFKGYRPPSSPGSCDYKRGVCGIGSWRPEIPPKHDIRGLKRRHIPRSYHIRCLCKMCSRPYTYTSASTPKLQDFRPTDVRIDDREEKRCPVVGVRVGEVEGIIDESERSRTRLTHAGGPDVGTSGGVATQLRSLSVPG